MLNELQHRSREGERERRRRALWVTRSVPAAADVLDDAALCAERARNQKRGIATLCLGGGNGVALAVEKTLVN